MNDFHSPWMDWEPKDNSPVSTVSSLDKQKGKNSMPDESSVSTVSSIAKNFPENINNKKDLKMLFYRTDSTDTTQPENSNLLVQRTDTTDRTPRIVDGHTVARIIWETEKAIVFADELGKYWRFLHAYGKAWPFIVG